MYSMFDLKFEDKGIYYFENVISYEKEFLDLLNKLDEIPESYIRIPKWEPWYASNDKSYHYGDRKNLVKDRLSLSTGNDLLDKNTLYILNSIYMAPEMCASKYCEVTGIDKNEINLDLSHITLKKYYTGQGMGPHYDGQDGDSFLRFSLVTYINDDYEGGELVFPNQDVKLKPKAGSLVMFPSQKPYIHQALPITSGNKYIYNAHWIV